MSDLDAEQLLRRNFHRNQRLVKKYVRNLKYGRDFESAAEKDSNYILFREWHNIKEIMTPQFGVWTDRFRFRPKGCRDVTNYETLLISPDRTEIFDANVFFMKVCDLEKNFRIKTREDKILCIETISHVMDGYTIPIYIFCNRKARKLRKTFLRLWKTLMTEEKDEVVKKMMKSNWKVYNSWKMNILAEDLAPEWGHESGHELAEGNCSFLRNEKILHLIRYVEKMYDPIEVGR
jgi:hypothetical protein